MRTKCSLAWGAGSMSGGLSGDMYWSPSLTDRACQLAGQLQHGSIINRITAARRLQRIAASEPQVWDKCSLPQQV